MELEQLKVVFVRQKEQPSLAGHTRVLGDILKRKTTSPLSPLKKNLQLEFVLAIAFLAFPCYIMLRFYNSYVLLYALPVMSIAAIFILRVISILRAINHYEKASYAIRQHLQLLIRILKKFRRLYIQSTMVSLPLLFMTAFIVIQLDNSRTDPLLFSKPSDESLLLYLAISLTWSVSMYFITKWYVEKLYGKHLQRLVKQLDEMNASA